MARKRYSATAARQRARSAHRWGVYTLAGALLLFMVGAGVVSQMLWASAAPEPAAAPAASTASPATNTAGEFRVAGNDDSAQTLSLYGGQMRPLVEERGGVQTLNIYGPGGRIIAQVVRDGKGSEEVRYLLTDHLGSTRVVVDAEGNAVARYEYAPHGETTVAGSSGAEVQYRYTGHPYNEGQEVYETPARVYDPMLGRFLSVDPQRQDASPYVYAGNNPVGYLDPSGAIREPFFIVSDGMISNQLPITEAVLALFGRPASGTSRGITAFSDLAAIASHGIPSDALPDASRVLTGGVTGIERSREAFIFIGSNTTTDDVRNITEGLKGIKYVSRESRGGSHDFLLEDIRIIGTEGGWSMAEALFASLNESGFTRIRAYKHEYSVMPAPHGYPSNLSIRVEVLESRRNNGPDLMTVRRYMGPGDYSRSMGLAPTNQGNVVFPVSANLDNWVRSQIRSARTRARDEQVVPGEMIPDESPPRGRPVVPSLLTLRQVEPLGESVVPRVEGVWDE